MERAFLPLLSVGAGGFIGAVLRYLLAVSLAPFSISFPFGTLAANLGGCFAIGAVAALAFDHGLLSTNARLFLITGVCGGFTTLSSVAYEGAQLTRDTEFWVLSLYIGATLIGAAVFFVLGAATVALVYRG